MSSHDNRLVLLQALTEIGYDGKIAVATQRIGDHEELKLGGAHLIFHPYYDAANRAIELLHSEEDGGLEEYEIEEQWQL